MALANRARAIENQCFMFGVNRIDIDCNCLNYQESSIVVTQDCELLEPVVPGHELDIYDIKPSDAVNYRALYLTLCYKRYGLNPDLLRIN